MKVVNWVGPKEAQGKIIEGIKRGAGIHGLKS